MLEKVLFILLGVLISGAGYLIKRWIEKSSEFESLDKHKKLLDIHKQMNEQGIDIDSLKAFESRLVGKTVAIQRHTLELQSETTPLIGSLEDEHLTQLELTERANEKLKLARARMQDAIAGIDARVGDAQSQALMKSQTEWEGYCESQARAIASQYEGGSIYGFVYISELESLANERTARLQAELDELISLGN